MDVLVALLLVVVLLTTAGAWLLPSGRGRSVASWVQVAALAAVGLVALFHGSLTGADSASGRALLLGLLVVAVAGGGPVTAEVLRLADGRPTGGGLSDAEQVLRGGTWIGVLERFAVFATLAAGWPEGLAVTLALKGLGRYSELRTDAPGSTGTGTGTGAGSGVAERFIIGTFTSVLWAVACAGLTVTLTT